MAGFIDYSIETDVDALIQRAFDQITADFPGWIANEAHLEVVLVEELVRIVAEARAVAADVPKAIFSAFGQKLAGIARVSGARAALFSTWTALDTAGYTLPEGTVVGFRAAGDDLWLFTVAQAVAIPAGDDSATDVQLRALDAGSDRNAVPSGTTLELVDALAWVSSIVTTSASEGGTDAETDDAYLDRLAEELALLAPRPILPGDFEVLARRASGVYRARALDGYDPSTATFGHERMVGVAAVDDAGAAIASPVKAALQADLDARREVNFVVGVFDPTFTIVDVHFEAVATADAVAADVQVAGADAVSAFLSPTSFAGGDESPPVWKPENVVRRLELAAVLAAVPGLDHVTVLTLGVNGGAQSAADVNLTGDAPLPTVGAITGVVT